MLQQTTKSGHIEGHTFCLQTDAQGYTSSASPGIMPVTGKNATEQLDDLFIEAPVSSSIEICSPFADMAAMVRIVDERDQLLCVNKSWSRYTGLGREELLAEGWPAIIHPDDMPGAIEKYQEQIQQQEPITIEYRLRNNVGEYQWVRDTGMPRFSEQGVFQGYIITTTNIHSRKIAVEKTFLQLQAVNNVSDAIISTDLQFTVTVFNKAAENIYGIPASRILGHPIRDFIDHKYPECTREEALKELYLKDAWEGLAYFDRADGKRIYMRCSLAFVKDHDGRRVGIAGIHRDITTLREAEIARYKQEQLLRLEKQVLEMNALPGISLKTITDYFLEGLECFFPGMLCSVITVNPDHGGLDHLSAPSIPAAYTTIIRNLKPGPSVGSCGTAIWRKQPVISSDISQDPLWEDYRSVADKFGLKACWSFPILNGQQEVVATIAAYYKYPKTPGAEEPAIFERVGNLLRIIIENKNAEARIRISHERYLLVTRVTNDAIWDWDVLNNGSMHLGEGFYTLFGYRPGYIQQSAGFWESCIHPDDRERVVTRLEQFINSNKSRTWEDEYRFRKANGEYALVHDRGFLIFDHEGKINRMIGSMQNITEKKELEKQLLKQELDKQKSIAQAVVNAQEKERADIGKELHDNVNQILTTAKLYLEMAKHEETETTELINRCSDNISDAINEIRSISRSLVPASIGDLGLIVSIQDLVENINATKQLEMEFRHRGDIDATIDEKRKLMLFRIIQEQVNNVLKHAGAARALIELAVDPRTIDLTIRDNGKGFEPEKVKAKKGVGLSNIASRAQLFNGRVNITTAPGEGCTLNINVPL
jgi:PAS domain S-box-containing protein